MLLVVSLHIFESKAQLLPNSRLMQGGNGLNVTLEIVFVCWYRSRQFINVRWVYGVACNDIIFFFTAKILVIFKISARIPET